MRPLLFRRYETLCVFYGSKYFRKIPAFENITKRRFYYLIKLSKVKVPSKSKGLQVLCSKVQDDSSFNSYRMKTLLFQYVSRAFSTVGSRKNYYDVLGLTSTATQKQIKAAYYEMSKKYHPDVATGGKKSHDMFTKITEAYEVLGNVKRREEYDESNFNSRYRRVYDEDNYTESYGPRYRKNRPPPPTGRTKHYNYDEHYRQHYGENPFEQKKQYEDSTRRYHETFNQRDFDPYRNSFEEFYRQHMEEIRRTEQEKQMEFDLKQKRQSANPANFLIVIGILFCWMYMMANMPDNIERIRRGRND